LPADNVIEGQFTEEKPEEKPKPEIKVEKEEKAVKQQIAVVDNSGYSIYFDTAKFQQASRAAVMLSQSTIVPASYRGNVANCLIALDMSANIGVNPMLCMQKAPIIHDKITFEGQLVITLVNRMKPFATAISFEYEGDVSDLNAYSCTAYATSKTGQRVEYKLKYKDAIKIGNASSNKNWQNATQLMISYRAATYLVRLHAPEILFGCYTVDEVQDIEGMINVTPVGKRAEIHAELESLNTTNEVSEL
jgi:hypothetical protein